MKPASASWRHGAGRKGAAFYLAWGRDEADASQAASLARAAGTIGRGDLVVVARWPEGAGALPPSRWVERRERLDLIEDRALFAELERAVERAGLAEGNSGAETGALAEAARIAAMTDAEIYAAALGTELR